MNENEVKFLLWGCGVLLAILGFIGALAVKSLMSMANDIGEIKIAIKEHEVRHDDLKRRVENIEHKLYA